MKILFLDPYKLNTKDGCNVHRLELVKCFLELNDEVYVFTTDKSESNYGSLLNESTINITRVNPKKYLKLLSYAYSLISVSLKEKMDILYTRNPIYCAFGIMIKAANKSKLIFEKNGIIGDEARLYLRKESKTSKVLDWNPDIFSKAVNKIHPLMFLESIELFFLQYSDIIIVVTPLLKKYLIEKGIDEKKIHIIENGANIDLFKPIKKEIAREELGLDIKSNYVCFVGNLVQWQGLEYLVEAAPLVLEKIQVNFLIVGDGIQKEKLEKMANRLGIKNNFTFTGLVPYESVPLYINASDVCVAPFIKERNERIGLSPLKIYEYMACGKPVISSRIPNLEFIEEQSAGYLVEPENSSELANSLITFYSTKEFKNLELKSRDYIIKNNNWKSVCEKIKLLAATRP